MAARKRSNPEQLRKEQAAIKKDVAPRIPKPSLPSRIGSAVKSRIIERKRRAAGYGSPPRVRGAMVYGSRKPDNTA